MSEWYSPGEIKFTRSQLRDFILPIIIDLEQGLYPNRPDVGYIEAEYKTWTTKTKAYFEDAVLIAAEVNYRIEHTPDGQVLKDRYTFHLSDNDIAHKYKIDRLGVGYFIGTRLGYISGFRRKRTDFQTWLRNERKNQRRRQNGVIGGVNDGVFKNEL